MVRPDACRDGHFEVRRFCDSLGGQIGGPKGLGYDYVGIWQLLFENRIGTVFVRGDDELDGRVQPGMALNRVHPKQNLRGGQV